MGNVFEDNKHSTPDEEPEDLKEQIRAIDKQIDRLDNEIADLKLERASLIHRLMT